MKPRADDSGDGAAEIAADPAVAPHSGLAAQLGLMARALLASPAGRPLLALVAAIVLVIVATAYGQIRLNSWNKPFFDALSRRDMAEFVVQLGVFFSIAAVLLVLNVAQRWLVEMLKVRLREGLVVDLLQGWLQPRRAFWLANAGAIGDNPDQRMHEDARKLCELSADLGAGLLQSVILFVTFAGVLWVVSADFRIRVGADSYGVPGFMLWAAIAYAGAGSLLSYRVGRGLIRRNALRYAREADLRFSLVRINEHLDGIALAAGEADERRRLEIDLTEVLRRHAPAGHRPDQSHLGDGRLRLGHQCRPDHGRGAAVLRRQAISFGGMMMAAAAFTQAESSLRWFVDNFSVIADWRATLLRVANFRHALMQTPVPPQFDCRIDYATGPAGRLAIDGLEVASHAGLEVLLERHVTVQAGERILVVGAPGTGHAPLFRALAGLWPWGRGRITRPADEMTLYVPRGTPYLPRGTLREILAYPQAAERFAPAAFAHALARLGLERLGPMLDLSRHWEQELSQDEQISLAFARIVLQAPPWVLMDDAFSALSDEALARVVDVLSGELARTALIYIGRAAQVRDPFFTTVLHLVRAQDAPGPALPAASDAACAQRQQAH